MARFEFQPSEQVEKLMGQEEQALSQILKESDPLAWAKNPRLTALMALQDIIRDDLVRRPFAYSLPAGDPDPALRYVETYGWRLIIEIIPEKPPSLGTVQGHFLAPISQALVTTIETWRKSQSE